MHREKASQEYVRAAIKRVLDDKLPKSYDRKMFSVKSDVVFQHFYERAEAERVFV